MESSTCKRAGRLSCPLTSFPAGFQGRFPPRLWGTCPTALGATRSTEMGMPALTLASCSPRPRGTSRSFSLSILLPSRSTGIRSPTASCGTDIPTQRSIHRENQGAGLECWMERHIRLRMPSCCNRPGDNRGILTVETHLLWQPLFTRLLPGAQGPPLGASGYLQSLSVQ